MQHGQKITDGPKRWLRDAGFQLRDVPEGHICCGSAGTYNILQPAFADRLRARKVGNIERVKPQIIATGNIGCMTQLAKGFTDRGQDVAIVHTVELLDWATGGIWPIEHPDRFSFGGGRLQNVAQRCDESVNSTSKIL